MINIKRNLTQILLLGAMLLQAVTSHVKTVTKVGLILTWRKTGMEQRHEI
jgi:hypothetical protein